MFEKLKKLLTMQREELKKALLMSAFFFFIIATFWIVKPIKRGLLIGYYKEHAFNFLGWSMGGAETEQLAKVLNMVAAFGVALLFAFLSRKLSRRNLLLVLCAIFGASFLLYGSMVSGAGPITIWSF